ncbi:hypothetical protein DV515_00006419 [Chloebia gouldiae]|uniref:Uncharacterized protein n=1 Tax=Chloebia gouldiae TaxID=44316 RepID=A0A3L8SL97_CHLGU|nr:hypothetical protein DV515_00006419 [Chloebia gouldiae]
MCRHSWNRRKHRELFTTPDSVYGNCMETSVDVQSYQLAPCLEVVVAAEKGGSTAPGRVLGEDTAAWPSRGIPAPASCPPGCVLPLGLATCASPWRGWTP